MNNHNLRIKIAQDFINLCKRKYQGDEDYQELLASHKFIAERLTAGVPVKKIYELKTLLYMSAAHWLVDRIGTSDYPKV